MLHLIAAIVIAGLIIGAISNSPGILDNFVKGFLIGLLFIGVPIVAAIIYLVALSYQ